MDGLRALNDAFGKLGHDMQRRIARRATGKAAAIVKAAVAAKAAQQPTLADSPYRLPDGSIAQPGHIAANVIAVRVKNPESTSEHVVAVRSNASNGYAGAIASLNEFGTVNMPAQPFMGPAWDATKYEASQAISHEVERGIATAARKHRGG